MNSKQNYCGKYKAQYIERSYSSIQKKEIITCEVYDNAVILPAKKMDNGLLWGNGGVMDSNGNYVSLSAQNPPKRIDFGYACEDAEYSDKTVVYCGYLTNHWGHFLLDCTSRLWYCLKNKDIDEYIFIRNLGDKDNTLKGNIKEFFRLLGILEKVRIITTPVRFKQVYVPELSYIYDLFWSEEFLKVFDYIAENAMAENSDNTIFPSNTVFFSRSHFKAALDKEIGLEMLDSYFSNNGYALYWPEEMTLSKMICVIRKAEICAFQSGTPQHNMLFARKGQKAVVIEKQAFINHYQCNVDVIRNLDTIYVDGHFTVYPVYMGNGPFFMAYNECLKRFTDDYGYLPPDSYYLSKKYKKSCLREFMNTYRKRYGEVLCVQSWHPLYGACFFEGYLNSKDELHAFLSGQEFYSYSQLLRWPVLKTHLKRILKNIICKKRMS